MSTTTDQYPARNDVFYGRGVWSLGEGGDEGYIAEGHGPRTLAAINACERAATGRPLARGEYSSSSPEPRWLIFHETCGCTEEQHAEHVESVRGRDENWPRLAFTEDVREVCDAACGRPELEPCAGEPLYAWMPEYVSEGTPGALPVTVVLS